MVAMSAEFSKFSVYIQNALDKLSAASSAANVRDALQSSGTTAFIQSVLKAYTGLSDAEIIVTRSGLPTASTSLLYRTTGKETPTERKNAIALIRSYGNVKAHTRLPLVRDLFNVARGIQTKTVLTIPDISQFRIYINVSRALFVPDDAGNYPFTAREIAGILCHEIGHSVWNVLGSDELLQVDLAFHQVIAYSKTNPPISELKDILAILIKRKLYPPTYEKTIKALVAMPVTDDSKDYRNFSEVAVWLIMVSSVLCKESLIQTMCPSPTNRVSGASSQTAMERYCDTFAGQCGYGADLAQAFIKFDKILYSPTAMASRDNLPYLMGVVIAALHSGADMAFGNYDALYDRISASINATKRALSDETLTPDEKKVMLQSITQAQEAVAAYKSIPYVKVRHAIASLERLVTTTRRLTLGDLADTLRGTYADFHEAVEVYNSGELAYMASLLE